MEISVTYTEGMNMAVIRSVFEPRPLDPQMAIFLVFNANNELKLI